MINANFSSQNNPYMQQTNYPPAPEQGQGLYGALNTNQAQPTFHNPNQPQYAPDGFGMNFPIYNQQPLNPIYGAPVPSPEGRLFGYLDDFDTSSGESDNICKVIEKLNKGKKIKGEQIRDLLPLIRDGKVINQFCSALSPQCVDSFELPHLSKAIVNLKVHDSLKDVVFALYPLVTTKPEALATQQLLDVIPFEKDKREIKAKFNLV